MVLNTITVGAAVTPTIISTGVSHYVNRKPLRQKPTAHIEYHQGIACVRAFLHHASLHTVDEVQAFTQQWVPVPHWVKTHEVEIPSEQLTASADTLRKQLGPDGVAAVGGETWWIWRGAKGPLKAEWIEMRNDYNERKAIGTKSERIMLYVHGGAYFFGSVDEHRYQMQRHARKLKARVLAPRYRLAPQFPFPCGLYDCLATYLWLLEEHDPSSILLAGDSAGGGMTLSLLCILRDQGIPMPAGAILLSPWVDLTHSFPSLGGDGGMDYIPAHGFLHKPNMSWPPPNKDDVIKVRKGEVRPHEMVRNPSMVDKVTDEHGLKRQTTEEAIQGFQVLAKQTDDTATKEEPPPATREVNENIPERPKKPVQGLMEDKDLEITIDGKLIRIRDQIQMYAPNHLLTHPLVSPVLQPSLGGLPPLLIQVGGGELLRDEQIYLAHKAAHPERYKPSEAYLDQFDPDREICGKWDRKPTNVQLQVWDDLCHVPHTLSWTRPAKYMYRSVAQFGAWALARAQRRAIDIQDDDDISIVSSISDSPKEDDTELEKTDGKASGRKRGLSHGQYASVGKAGDPLPPFVDHMIRQRVDRYGKVYRLSLVADLPALNMRPGDIGVIKEGPVRKWMAAQQKWNSKFARAKRSVQKKRMLEMAKGYEGFDGEKPPPTALAGRRKLGEKEAQKLEKSRLKKNWGIAMWSGWGSKHDQATINRERRASTLDGKTPRPRGLSNHMRSNSGIKLDEPRSDKLGVDRPALAPKAHSHVTMRSVQDEGQTSSARNSTSFNPIHMPRTPNPTSTAAPQLPPLEPPPKSPRRSNSSRPSPIDAAINGYWTPTYSQSHFEDGLIRPDTPEKSPKRASYYGTNPSSARPSISERISRDELRGDYDLIPEPLFNHGHGIGVTVIPPSDTGTTRPTLDGIAYPFKLNTGPDGRSANASMITLNGTPLEGSFRLEEDKRGEQSSYNESGRLREKDSGFDVGEETKRPGVERFVTASEGL